MPARPHPVLIPAILLIAAAIAAGWWWHGRPRDAGPPMPDGRINSVSFAPFRPGQSPLADRFPTAAQVEEDIRLIAPSVRAIRTYASIEGQYEVAELAQRHGLRVWKGAWLGTDRRGNVREIERLVQTANRFPETIERVVVGNEVLLRRDLGPQELIAHIRDVRARVPQPVTYADVWEFWEQFPEVAEHVDIVTIHILPYWEDHPLPVERAIAHAVEIVQRMRARFPGKPIAIGEIGWPSAGRWRADAAPGRVAQARFVREFAAVAAREGFDWNLIEAFDQVWKARNEGAVGAEWGLWTADRRPKFSLTGPVSDDPAWPAHAAASIVVFLALLAGTLALFPLPGRTQPRAAVLAGALGAGLVFAWDGTWPLVTSHHQMLAFWVNMAGQALLAMLLMRQAALHWTGAPIPPPPSGQETTQAVRGLFRLRRPAGLPGTAFGHLTMLFLWTAAVMQLLLAADPRYRDFPLPVFIVPLVATATRLLLRDPFALRGREEVTAAGTLALAALWSLVAEGALNQQSLVWNAAALMLAAPVLSSSGSTAQPSGQAERV
jgi:exo-beta-1,3-glucanase (GH17 family)